MRGEPLDNLHRGDLIRVGLVHPPRILIGEFLEILKDDGLWLLKLREPSTRVVMIPTEQIDVIDFVDP